MKGKSVRLRRATIDDYDFCRMLYDDITYEILYCNRKAFSLPEIQENDGEEIEFEAHMLTMDWFIKCLTVWHHKVYIIELVNEKKVTRIGCFNIAKTGKGEPNRIRNWLMLEEYFDLKKEAMEALLCQSAMQGRKITVNISENDYAFDWLIENFGFKEDNTVLSSLSLN